MAAERVMVNPKRFAEGVKSARRLRGTFDPTTKTWLIPSEMVEFLGRPQWPGLIRVADRVVVETRCPHWTLDQGCPLHGEGCADGRGPR